MPERAIEEYRISEEPYYLPVDNEIDLFEAAHAAHLPVILKGPTGCGKTRFVEHMAWRLERPLITVACHEDLSSTDLVGRFLIEGEETVWHDGPLTSAVRHGAICYLDEVVEARKDTVVIIHPLTDHRRRLPIEKRGPILEAPSRAVPESRGARGLRDRWRQRDRRFDRRALLRPAGAGGVRRHRARALEEARREDRRARVPGADLSPVRPARHSRPAIGGRPGTPAARPP